MDCFTLLKEELTRDEGMRLTAYKDSVGLWTIGVGHLLGSTPRMTVITAAEADALLTADLQAAIARAKSLCPSFGVGEGRHVRDRALVNMAFNLGNRLAGFKKFLAAVNSNDWATAGVEMMDSQWAKQVGARAVRLRKMIETEEA
jgi:lysozyme